MAEFLEDFGSSSDDGELSRPHAQPRPVTVATQATTGDGACAGAADAGVGDTVPELAPTTGSAGGVRTAGSAGEPAGPRPQEQAAGFAFVSCGSAPLLLAEAALESNGCDDEAQLEPYTAISPRRALWSLTGAPACAAGWCPQVADPATAATSTELVLAIGTYFLEPEAGSAEATEAAEAEAARQLRTAQLHATRAPTAGRSAEVCHGHGALVCRLMQLYRICAESYMDVTTQGSEMLTPTNESASAADRRAPAPFCSTMYLAHCLPSASVPGPASILDLTRH